ncbi:MAG: EAL domain-containing protein, partial [Clostridiales bacterium]
LTESAVFLGLDNMIEIMHNIKKAGFLLSIDDFGSGYSSLGALKDLPTDFVKLDKSFLDDSVNNQRSESIIRNIISMTKGLGIATVAEGVEDAAQANLLRSAGCDIVQGFYFSKPITIEEFEKIIF